MGEWHVPAQAVVARSVLELDTDTGERLARPQLVRRRHVGRDGHPGPGGAGRLDGNGPLVATADREAAEERSGRARLDHHGERLLDDRVGRGRPVVVAVAEITD